MTFTMYAQYVAFAALMLLAIIVVSLAFKAWIEDAYFQMRIIYLKSVYRIEDEIMQEKKSKDFEQHVWTTPGMQYLN